MSQFFRSQVFVQIATIGGVLLFHSVAPPIALSADAFEATRLDGSQEVVSIVSIETGGRLQVQGQPKPTELSGLRRLRRVKAAGATSRDSDITVLLEYGGVLKTQSVTVKNEKVGVSVGRSGAAASLPLETVRAIQFEPKPSPLFQRALQSPVADYDRFLVRIEGKVQTVRGLLESLDANAAAIVVNDRNVKVQRADLQAIVFASVKPKKITSGMVRAHLNDGSRVVAKVDSLSKAGVLKLKLSQGTIPVAWASVNTVDVYSDRLRYVSDLKPAAVNERAIVTLAQSWKKDRSVTGGPLTVGGKTYEKGLGVHARSELTFAVDEQYETFSAVIGLDEGNGRKGDCEFVVRADGRELYRKRLTGKDKPVRVNVKIAGAKRLTLLVEPGKNLDIADHANWCAASLIRSAK